MKSLWTKTASEKGLWAEKGSTQVHKRFSKSDGRLLAMLDQAVLACFCFVSVLPSSSTPKVSKKPILRSTKPALNMVQNCFSTALRVVSGRLTPVCPRVRSVRGVQCADCSVRSVQGAGCTVRCAVCNLQSARFALLSIQGAVRCAECTVRRVCAAQRGRRAGAVCMGA